MGAWRGGFGLPVKVYDLISAQCERVGADVVRWRLPRGRSVIGMRGEAAARLFYDSDRFRRAGAAPRRATATLFGEGGVQQLDGPAHRHRKALFLSLMGTEALDDLRARFAAAWDRAAERWAADGGPALPNSGFVIADVRRASLPTAEPAPRSPTG